MRKLIAITGALALAGAVAVPAVATPGDPHKDVVCHATSSQKNPYVIIFVDTASANGQKRYEAHYEHMVNSNKKHGHADEIYTLVEWVDRGEVCGVVDDPDQ